VSKRALTGRNTIWLHPVNLPFGQGRHDEIDLVNAMGCFCLHPVGAVDQKECMIYDI